MEHLLNSNGLVIVGSLIVIISWLFNLVAKRYSIPSILLLILVSSLMMAFSMIRHRSGLRKIEEFSYDPGSSGITPAVEKSDPDGDRFVPSDGSFPTNNDTPI